MQACQEPGAFLPSFVTPGVVPTIRMCQQLLAIIPDVSVQPLMTAREMFRPLNMSDTTGYALIERGYFPIPLRKIGGRWIGTPSTSAGTSDWIPSIAEARPRQGRASTLYRRRYRSYVVGVSLNDRERNTPMTNSQAKAHDRRGSPPGCRRLPIARRPGARPPCRRHQSPRTAAADRPRHRGTDPRRPQPRTSLRDRRYRTDHCRPRRRAPRAVRPVGQRLQATHDDRCRGRWRPRSC